MATRIVHQLIDDLDGTVLPDGAGETLLFGLDDGSYEIDLGGENAAALRELFARYIDAGRRQDAGKPDQTGTPVHGRRRSPAAWHTGNVRDWAAAQGIEVPARGWIPNAVLEAYRAAHPA